MHIPDPTAVPMKMKCLTNTGCYFWPQHCTFGELPHGLHVGRQVLSHQGDQSMVMLQLVDQVMAVKHMRTPLGLTEEKTGGGVEVVRGTHTKIH